MTDIETDDYTTAFFLESGSDQLARIYWWARARFAAPWAVFFAVLLRVAASVGPPVQLPGKIGGRASLNLLVAFVSPSGGGKGISDKVARLAWPTPILEVPIGSGEGIAELFKAPAKPDADNEPVTAAIINVPEIDTLAGIASRQGSILLAQLKSMAMGEQLGQSNASKATSRIVQPHSYRCCMSVGAQPGHTGVLFNDTTGGTPQRFLWAPTIDPTMPAEATADPEPLNTTLPSWSPGDDGVIEIVYGIAEIGDQIIAAHLARQRGEAGALDGHHMLTRCKVAAVIAIMHGRSVVSEWDWERSADVMAVSDRTRDWIVTEASKAARAKVRERAVARAVGEDFYDASRLETVKRSVLRMLEKDGEQAGGDLRRRLGKREKRELFDQAVSLLEADGLVYSRPGEHNSVRYRIGSPVTTEVTPQKASSDGVTTAVTRDRHENITDLDSRRSRNPINPELSGPKWFAKHIAGLRAAGHRTVESFAVYAAAEAAGYLTATIATAASQHPDVRVIAKASNGATTWSIDPTYDVEYKTVGKWVEEYFDSLPPTVERIDPNHLRAAGDADGLHWQNLRQTVKRHPRITSPERGVWLLRPRMEGTTA